MRAWVCELSVRPYVRYQYCTNRNRSYVIVVYGDLSKNQWVDVTAIIVHEMHFVSDTNLCENIIFIHIEFVGCSVFVVSDHDVLSCNLSWKSITVQHQLIIYSIWLKYQLAPKIELQLKTDTAVWFPRLCLCAVFVSARCIVIATFDQTVTVIVCLGQFLSLTFRNISSNS